ncbi:MAG: hypothetical protein ACRC1P_10385 [Cellulosilyticaceae bacterium]
MSRNNKIEGIGSVTEGEYDVVSIEGIGKIKGNVSCNKLVVEGIYKGKGIVKTSSFECEGMARILKNMKATNVRIEGMVKIKGAKLEAETISCEGLLTCTEEVSADTITIDGLCSVAKMYGDKIHISTANMNGNMNIPKAIGGFASMYIGRRVNRDYCIVDTIECSELEADHLESKVIKAHSIKLGPECKIGRIECDGTLEYDESCKIGKIIASKVNKKTGSNLINKGEIDMADIKLTKILDMYKASKINADEAEQMLKSLGSIGGTTGNTRSQETPKFSDDKLRVVVMRGNKVISQREYSKGMSINVEYQGDVADVECWGSLSCGNVKGNASAGTSIKAVNIGNNASAGTSIECNDVTNNVSAGTSVNCKEVNGNINAGGGVRINK